MKKTYQTPATAILAVETQNIMAGSVNLRANGDNLTQTLGEETTATSGNLSRRRNVWDEEDDEY